MSTNPLLDTSGLPLFDQIKPEHVTPALDVLLADAEASLTKVTGPDVPPDYDALSLLLDVSTERLGRAWAPWVTSTAWPTRPSCVRRSTTTCPA